MHTTVAEEMEVLWFETLKSFFNKQQERVKKLYFKAKHFLHKETNDAYSLTADKFIFPLIHQFDLFFSWENAYLNMYPPRSSAKYYKQINSSKN